MATTNDLINGLKASKEAIRQAIIAKGVDVPESTLLSGYAPLVEAISGGGGGFDYKAKMDEVTATIESGIADVCVVFFILGNKTSNKFNPFGYGETINRMDFSDGTSLTDASSAHNVTELLDGDGFQYYWVKCYVNTLSQMSIPTTNSPIFMVSYKVLNGSETPTVVTANLKYLDLGGGSISKISAVTDGNPCIEYLYNVKYTGSSMDFRPAKYLRKCTFTDLSSVSDVNMSNNDFVSEETVTGIINALPEAGWGSSFDYYSLTDGQKTLLDAKGWSY